VHGIKMTERQDKKCPHCGRKLTDDEMYCYFCEMEVEEE